MLFWTGHFDRFSMSQIDLYGAVPDLVALLRDFRPDVVASPPSAADRRGISRPRAAHPAHARIVMTLHDYYPICHHDGLMARTKGGQRCMGASPDACHACFPEIPTERSCCASSI